MKRVVVGALALVLLLGSLLLASSAMPATAAPDPSVTGVHLVLESLSPTAVEPGKQVSATVRIVNQSTTTLSDARVRLFVNSPTLTSRSAVAAWANDEGVQGGDRFTGVTGAEHALGAPVPAGGSAQVTITISADQLHLGSTWGARGVTIDILNASLTRLDAVRTFLVWTPSRATLPRADLAVLTPVTAGPPDLTTGAISADHLASLTAAGGRLSRVVAAASGDGASLVVDPATLGTPAPGVAVTSAGTSGAGATPWQQQVAAATSGGGTPSVLPWDDADAASLASARTGDLYRTAVDESRSRSATVLGGSPSVLTWPVDGDVDAATVALATAAGSSAVVLSSGDVSAAPGRVALAAGGERSRTPGVVVDATSSAVLAAGTNAGSTSGPALATARLLADTAVAARSGADVVLATPRDWDPDPGATHIVLSTLGAAAWVRPASLSTLLAQSAGATVDAPAQISHADQLPADGLHHVAAALAAVTPVAGLVTDPAAFLAPLRERALAATSSAWRGQEATWNTGVAALVAAAQTQALGVSVVQGSPVTVISSRASLPITVRNSLNQDVEVVVGLRSASLRLDPLGKREVMIPASSQQRVLLPVKALASGDARLSVTLSTRSGRQVGTGGPVQVRVRADWEGRGVAVFGALVALVLFVGVVRTVRRVRRGEAPRQAARQAARAAGQPAGRPPTAGRANQASHASGSSRRPGAPHADLVREPEHHA